MTETPSITKNFYLSNTYTGDDIGSALAAASATGGRAALLMKAAPGPREDTWRAASSSQVRTEEKDEWTMRIVKVFIVDANENIPLEQRVLYRGDEKLTDLTDQELFFEIGIQPLLAAHNQMRITVLDRKASTAMGKPVHLEPVRIRDLKMNVVEVAKF